MPGWSRVQNLNQYTRPLGLIESAYFWDSQAAGISDSLGQFAVEVHLPEAPRIFSLENVSRAWIALKKLNPTLSAVVQEQSSTVSGANFLIDPSHISTIGTDEITYAYSDSDEDACDLVNEIVNGPRRLSNERLARLWVVSLPSNNSKSSPSARYQLFIYMAHCIMDGMSQYFLIKSFFDILVHSSLPDKYIPKQSLERRLALHLCAEDLNPARRAPLARQRWRYAIAHAIHSRRTASLKGGQTLPRNTTPHTPENPITSRTFRVDLSKDLTRRLLATCRRAGITFGSAITVLAQVAHSRVLHRCYARGSITEAEWRQRTREPMHFLGPVNIRSYLEPEWLTSGGDSQLCVAISLYRTSLPCMPIASSESGPLEDPVFEELLSKERFFYRCRMAGKQAREFYKHPLLMEFADILQVGLFTRGKEHALKWREDMEKVRRGIKLDSDAENRVDAYKNDFILSNTSSSAGDLSPLIPAEYPLGRNKGERPLLRIISICHNLRCRPGELYLTSTSYNQQLQLMAICDCTAYDESMLKEWFAYVQEGVEWYLGATEVMHAESNRARL